MASPSRSTEVAAVDEFLEASKGLQGPPPIWGSGFAGERHAIWNIQESSGVVRAHLRFRFPVTHRTSPSISVIVRNRMVWRIDLIDGIVIKLNPPSAHALGLPAVITGSHEHRWDDNRPLIAAGGPWELPIRRPTHAQLRRLPQALPVIAASIKLDILPDQRDFDVPPASTLFE